MKPLTERALQVHFGISQWYNKTNDPKLAKEIAVAHGLDNPEDAYVKRPIPKIALKGVVAAANKARAAHIKNTLPWHDGGIRILPSTHYFNYVQEMNLRKAEFYAEVETFLLGYPAYKDAAKLHRKDTYREEDYPRVAELRDLFQIQISFMPMATNPNDFRLDDIDEEEMEALRTKMEANIQAAMLQAATWAKNTLTEPVVKLAAALSDPNKEFRDSLFNNLSEAVESYRTLALEDDPKLKTLHKQIEEQLCTHHPEKVRNDPTLRARLARTATKLLQSYNA